MNITNDLRPPLLLKLLDRVFVPDPTTVMSGEEQTRHEVIKASETMGDYLRELGQQRAGEFTILDFGCGWGGETLWLAGRVRAAYGVDVDRESIEQARKAQAVSGIKNCFFEWSEDGRLTFPDRSFDAVLSTDTFEHVMDLDLAFAEIARVLKPGGVLISRFGPLFYSPHGYHLYWACKVPYAHLLFGLKAIAAMRAWRGGSKRIPRTWQDLWLNGKRFDEYRASAARSGLENVRFEPMAVRGMSLATRIPLLKDLFIFGIDCHLRRPLVASASRASEPTSDGKSVC